MDCILGDTVQFSEEASKVTAVSPRAPRKGGGLPLGSHAGPVLSAYPFDRLQCIHPMPTNSSDSFCCSGPSCMGRRSTLSNWKVVSD